MNEFNIDEEEPDKAWEGFKKLLIAIVVVTIIGVIVIFKYC